MSPIKDLTDQIRLPRLGKIRLGVKEPGKAGKGDYPRAVDYFVCPPEVLEALGNQKPSELPIMFPTNDPDLVAQQWLRRYSLTQGLVCWGDGATARRKVDTATGDIASSKTEKWVWKEGLPCKAEECPDYQAKQCRRVMNLVFCLPDVPGLGVWQIDSTSRNSILNINNTIRLILKMTGGRLAFIPLTLALGPVQVTPPGEKTKTVFCLHLKSHVLLRDIVRAAMLPAPKALLPEASTDEAPEDLYPPGVLEEAETEAPAHPAQPGQASQPSPPGHPVALATPATQPAPPGPATLVSPAPPAQPGQAAPAATQASLLDQPGPAAPATGDPREALRDEIRALMLFGPWPSAAKILSWWNKHPWGYALDEEALTGSAPLSEDVKAEHLAEFLANLKTYQAVAAEEARKKAAGPGS